MLRMLVAPAWRKFSFGHSYFSVFSLDTNSDLPQHVFSVHVSLLHASVLHLVDGQQFQLSFVL